MKTLNEIERGTFLAYPHGHAARAAWDRIEELENDVSDLELALAEAQDHE